MINDVLEDLFDNDFGYFGSISAPVYAFCSMFIMGILFTIIGALSYVNHDSLAILLVGVSAIYGIAVLVNFFKLELIKSIQGVLSFIYILLSIAVFYSL